MFCLIRIFKRIKIQHQISKGKILPDSLVVEKKYFTNRHHLGSVKIDAFISLFKKPETKEGIEKILKENKINIPWDILNKLPRSKLTRYSNPELC